MTSLTASSLFSTYEKYAFGGSSLSPRPDREIEPPKVLMVMIMAPPVSLVLMLRGRLRSRSLLLG
jgi:hypothetical protein